MKKILMAEDEENISDFVSRGLRNFNYDVTVVDNGLDAWRLLQEGNGFDLVMLDIRMPGMSGLEVCRRIRDSFGYQIPVLMLTALDTTDDVVMGLQTGADEYQTLQVYGIACPHPGFTPQGRVWQGEHGAYLRRIAPGCLCPQGIPGQPGMGFERKGVPPAAISGGARGRNPLPQAVVKRCVGQGFRYQYQHRGCLRALSPPEN